MEECDVKMDMKDIVILGSFTTGEKQLLTLEALYQKQLNPSIDTNDEYKSRLLTIKFYSFSMLDQAYNMYIAHRVYLLKV